MRKALFLSLVAIAMVVVFTTGNLTLMAEEGSPKIESIDVKLWGENYCVACTLGKVGANSSCSTTGHRHALKVAKAGDSSGNSIANLKGKTVHYLFNPKGKEYFEGHHGELLVVTGKLFVNERVVDIANVKLIKDTVPKDPAMERFLYDSAVIDVPPHELRLIKPGTEH